MSNPRHAVSNDFSEQLQGKRLALAEVLYFMPDHPKLLQSFTWQTLDVAPDYPRIQRFLDFWRREIDAVIHSVSITSQGLIRPPAVRSARFRGVLQ